MLGRHLSLCNYPKPTTTESHGKASEHVDGGMVWEDPVPPELSRLDKPWEDS